MTPSAYKPERLSILLYLLLGYIDPSAAQVFGSNEAKWRLSIETDIRNGAPADAICINALSPATVSDDPGFKNWAYGVARKYCPPGKMGKPSNEGLGGSQAAAAQPESQAVQSGCRIMLAPTQIK